jgi:hypothetical protein
MSLKLKPSGAGAQVNCVHGHPNQVGANPDERRKMALTNFTKSW